VPDPVLDVPRELQRRVSSRDLLRRREFRRVFLAAGASELGDSLSYIALMWFAFERGGAAGVIVVRLADSLPALFFGLHGGMAADRFSRKRLMVGADTVRAIVLVPVAVAGLTGNLPIWGLAVAAFLLEAAASYFDPAYGALLPALVERPHIQRANGLVQSTLQSISIGGRGLAALLVAFVPVSAFFAVNAVSFVVSASLLAGLSVGREHLHLEPETTQLRSGLVALRALPLLAVAVVVFAVEITLVEGSWIGGVPKFVGDTLHRGAGAFSLMMIAYGLGSIGSGAILTRVHVAQKARVSMLVWVLYLPAFGLLAIATSLPLALLGAFVAGISQTASWVLLNSAAQEEVDDRLLGRVMGVIGLTHRGAHATALLFIAPLFVVATAPDVFAGVSVAAPAAALIGLAVVARAHATRRSRRS
jgi:MFS family permease